MKYDFETIIDRDPAIRGTGKYRIMKDSKGNKPPKGIVPLSVADMEFRTAPCVIDAIKAEADFGVLGYHRLTDSVRESCCQWMKTRHDWDVQPDWIVPFEQVVPALYNAVWTFTQPGDGILIQTPASHRVSRVRRYSGSSRTTFPFGYGAITRYGRPSHTVLLVPVAKKLSTTPEDKSSGLPSSAFARHY